MMNEFMMSSAEAYNKEGQLIGKGKLQFSIMNIDEATNELKASYKPDIPFTFYKNGKNNYEILSESKAIEYDDNGSKTGEGPIMIGTTEKTVVGRPLPVKCFTSMETKIKEWGKCRVLLVNS